jgi:hypothetical protein
MKMRLLPMGCVITAIGVILLAARGFATSFVGLSPVGIILLVPGLLWNWSVKEAGGSREFILPVRNTGIAYHWHQD